MLILGVYFIVYVDVPGVESSGFLKYDSDMRLHVSMATSGLPYEAVKTMNYTPNISTQHLKSGLLVEIEGDFITLFSRDNVVINKK